MGTDQDRLEPLISEFADDEEMMELIELFVAEMPGRVAALQSAFQQSAREDLQRLAHQLKGAAPGYGYPAIGDAAAELEDAAKGQAALEDLSQQLEELVNLCHRAAQTD
jgi:HPt (histidine-containing phosphotransfer) domain-containing protein